jgi:murein DD-endopeptidase MepM/ murein hydrolase activator NlpD
MTRLWTSAATLALATAGLAGCATPTYPTHAGYVPPEPIAPRYATRAGEAAPALTRASNVAAGPASPMLPQTPADAIAPAVTAQPLSAIESSELAPPAPAPEPVSHVTPDTLTPATAEMATGEPAAWTPSEPAAVSQPEPPMPQPVANPVPPEPPAAQTRSRRADPAEDIDAEPAFERRPQPRSAPTRLVATGRVVSVGGQLQTYVVRPGDHIDQLARDFNTSRRQILAANDIDNPDRIHPGDRLRMPAPPASAYVAAQGDTLSAVARRFSTSVSRLRALNRSASTTLRPGQRLLLPGNVRDIGPQRVPAPELARSEPQRPRPARNGLSVTETRMPPSARPPEPPPSAMASNAPPPAPAYTPPAPAYTPAPPSAPPPSAPASPDALIPYTRPSPNLTTVPAAERAAAAAAAEAPRAAEPPRPAAPPPAYSPPPARAAAPPARPATAPPAAYTPPRAAAPPRAPAYTPQIAQPAVRGAPPNVGSSPPVPDAQIASLGRGRFVWPIQGGIIGAFGPQAGGRRNDGVDIRAPQGMSVRAAAGGEVVYAGDQVPGFGNLVLIKHDDGWVTAYAHLGRIAVAMRQRIQQGQEIGTVGASGGVSEPQLHFEIRYAPTPADRARPIDPALVLPTAPAR